VRKKDAAALEDEAQRVLKFLGNAESAKSVE
jgi:hypothetical protein